MTDFLGMVKNRACTQDFAASSKVIATQEELVKAVAMWSEKQNRLIGMQQEYKVRLNALTEEFIKKSEIDILNCEVLEKLIVEYCSTHKSELLAKVGGKTVDFGVAKVAYRKRKPRLVINDESDLVKQLEERQLNCYVQVRKNVDLPALLNAWGVLNGILNGVELIENEESITLST